VEWEEGKAREDQETMDVMCQGDWEQQHHLHSINRNPSGTYHKHGKPDWNKKLKGKHGEESDGSKKKEQPSSREKMPPPERDLPRERELGYYTREADQLWECVCGYLNPDHRESCQVCPARKVPDSPLETLHSMQGDHRLALGGSSGLQSFHEHRKGDEHALLSVNTVFFRVCV